MKATVKAAKDKALETGAEWVNIPLKHGTQAGRKKSKGSGGKR